MSRNNLSGSRTKVMEIPKFNGLNTASSFSEIDISQSGSMLNALPNVLGGLKKRPGSIPLTDSPLPGPIYLVFAFNTGSTQTILVTSGNKLYKYDNGSFVEVGTLNANNIDFAQFKDGNGREVMLLTDGTQLKAYDGTTISAVVPAPNDTDPLPANDLANINAKGVKGCLVHNTRLVLWDGSDTIWHSKIGYHDYFPQVDFQRFVRENDKVQTCVTYKGALLVFMRRHIGVLFGQDRDNWQQDFLDTGSGLLAPRTVQTVMFPDGRQEVFYVSDDGVNSVYMINTLNLDNSARYSTKNISKESINWKDLGVSKNEWRNASAHFYNGQYWLIYQKGNEWKGLVYDTSMEQWFPIDNVKSRYMYHDENEFYFVGDEGHLKVLRDAYYSDWDDKAKTTGTPINFYWYSKLMTPKLTGVDHFWDVLMVEAKQFPVHSTLDVEVNTQKDQYSGPSVLKTAVFVWGQTKWGESEYANPKLTDNVNNAKRLRTFTKGQYAQVKLSNNRDEPTEIYGLRYEVRVMDTYY